MEIDIVEKMYILGQLQARGITFFIEQLDALKEELAPFAKSSIEYRCQNGGFPENEKPYAITMAKYFNLPADKLQ